MLMVSRTGRKEIKESPRLRGVNTKVEKLKADLRAALQEQKALSAEEWPTFEIWQESYNFAGCGKSGSARLHGKQVARTFEEACEDFFVKEGNLFWYKSRLKAGTKFFDNKEDANREHMCLEKKIDKMPHKEAIDTYKQCPRCFSTDTVQSGDDVHAGYDGWPRCSECGEV